MSCSSADRMNIVEDSRLAFLPQKFGLNLSQQLSQVFLRTPDIDRQGTSFANEDSENLSWKRERVSDMPFDTSEDAVCSQDFFW